MADLYPNVNSVVSNIIEEDIREQQVPPSPNAILIFGTATKGPLNTPTRVDNTNITDLFGSVPNDPYFNTSLVKGFHEIKKTVQNAEIVAVRIGDAKRAALTLYETRAFGGVNAPYSALTDTPSMTFEAKQDGPDGNNIYVSIVGDPSGYPVKMEIEDTNTGATATYDLSADGSIPGAYNRVSALASAINANTSINASIIANANILEGTSTVNIIQLVGGASGAIETEYQVGIGTTAGDKITSITSAYLEGSFRDIGSVNGGLTSAILQETPVKTAAEGDETIASFYSIVEDEVLFGPVLPGVSGEQVLTLAGTNGMVGWTGSNTDIKDVEVYRIDANTGAKTLLTNASEYTWTTGLTVTINAGTINPLGNDADVGDVFTANFKFKTSFVESSTRTGIQPGNRFSYFVAGNTITFGAAQLYDLELNYTTKTQYTIPGDIRISDADGSIIKFVNPLNMPVIGNAVTVEFLYEPELPAVTGSTLASGDVQGGQLTGGNDGRRMTTSSYYNALISGFAGADNTPCRIVVPQGVYIDDTMEAIDNETGLPTTANAGFQTLLSNFLRRKSQYVSECVGIMSTRPLVATNPANPLITEKEAWFAKIVTPSATDSTRAANVMNAIDDFHLIVTTGDLVGSLPEVLGGRSYVPNSANIYAGMKYAHDNLSSLLNKRLPATWISGIVYPIITADRVNTINGMRYTLFTQHALDGSIIIADAPTLARPTSQYVRQYVVDIVFEAVNAVRRVLDPFLGQPNVQSTRQAMESAAKIELQKMSPMKLRGLDVQIVPEGSAISGQTKVRLQLVTAVEIRKIALETRVKLGQ